MATSEKDNGKPKLPPLPLPLNYSPSMTIGMKYLRSMSSPSASCLRSDTLVRMMPLPCTRAN